MVRETWIQSQVASFQRLLKRYLIAPCLTLSNIRYISRVKWSNPTKGVAPFPTPRCSSYWKGSLRVTLDKGRRLYNFTTSFLFIYLFIYQFVGICKDLKNYIYIYIYIYIMNHYISFFKSMHIVTNWCFSLNISVVKSFYVLLKWSWRSIFSLFKLF